MRELLDDAVPRIAPASVIWPGAHFSLLWCFLLRIFLELHSVEFELLEDVEEEGLMEGEDWGDRGMIGLSLKARPQSHLAST